MSKGLKLPLNSRVIFSLFISLVVVALAKLASDFSNNCICHIPIPQDYNNYLIYKQNCQCEYVPLSKVIGQYLVFVVLPFFVSYFFISANEPDKDEE